MRSTIEFLRGGKLVKLDGAMPTDTLLDYLRETGSCGTKEGCAEGDCGACTVVLGSLDGDKVTYRPVNSCITFLPVLDGKELITVDDLSVKDGPLHPVQDAMVKHHASQCGFCTPGFVMAIFAQYHGNNADADHEGVVEQIAGNLCRCTGYRPITAAAMEVCARAPDDVFTSRMRDTSALLADISGGPLKMEKGGYMFAAPQSVAELAEVYSQHPGATLVAGATDVGLWVTKKHVDIKQVIYLGRVKELQDITSTDDAITLGAGVTFADAMPHLETYGDDFQAVLSRIGAKQVRAAGTIGGNIANGSPIGDTPPILISLDATITLQKGETTRTIALENFFIDYGSQDIGESEFVASITVPKPAANTHLKCYKISKRHDQDISAVLAAFNITLSGSVISKCRIAFGGMAATPKRALALEAALIGFDVSKFDIQDVPVSKLNQDFQPISDMRASAKYRSQVAGNLIIKALLELQASVAGDAA